MAADDGGHVAHTAVAGFYLVSVEQIVVLVIRLGLTDPWSITGCFTYLRAL